MKSGIKATWDNSEAILSALRELAGVDVLVGIPEDANARDDAPFGNAGIGYLNEYGSPDQNIPPRPHLHPGVRASEDETVPQLKLAASALLEGQQQRAERALNRAGLLAVNHVRRFIITGNLTPLADSTIYNRQHRAVARRTGKNPLIDTGEYRDAITYVVRTKNANA